MLFPTRHAEPSFGEPSAEGIRIQVDTVANVTHPALSLAMATLAVGGSHLEAAESIRVAGMGTLEALDAILGSDLDRLTQVRLAGTLAMTAKRGEPLTALVERVERAGLFRLVFGSYRSGFQCQSHAVGPLAARHRSVLAVPH